MAPSRLEKLLARLHQRAAQPSTHQSALRAELVAAYRKQVLAQSQSTLTERSSTMQRKMMLRLAVAFVFVLGLGAASRAPADYAVEVGRRIEISAAKPAKDWPSPMELQPVLQQLGHTHEVQFKAMRSPDGVKYSIEMWGQSIAADAVEQLRSAFPALREATITETPIEATAKGHLSDKIGLKLFNVKSDPAAIEQAKKELLEQLRARGEDGKVDIQVEDGDNGKRQVRVQVEKVEKREVGADAPKDAVKEDPKDATKEDKPGL
ncbi:MAG: hypothetical protein JST92_16980 [Deltaproteobacteria bacterium]|nr:hypothetical protein [Deltaproteobacteria bacterium]